MFPSTVCSEVKARMAALQDRKDILLKQLESANEPPPLLHTGMAELYRNQVTDLAKALEHLESRPGATEALRGLIEAIVLTPDHGELRIDLKGNLAAMLGREGERVGLCPDSARRDFGDPPRQFRTHEKPHDVSLNPYWTRTLEHVVSEDGIDRRSSSGTCGICAVATVSTTTRLCSTLFQRRLRANAGDVPVGCATVH